MVPRTLLRLLGGCILLAAACTTLRPVPQAQLDTSHLPTHIWVKRVDHTTVVVDSARLRGDTIVGLVAGRSERIPLSTTLAVYAREPSSVRTAALFIVLGGAMIAADVVGMNAASQPDAP